MSKTRREPETFLNGRVTLHSGECLAALATLDAESIDACVTDPPYHLTSIVKRFGAKNAAPAKSGKTGAYARASAGFMGKKWDGGSIAFQPETWAAVYRVLKPGAHLVAFGGTRTYHRLACAIEDAGFSIRDQIGWVFGSGFPKSRNVGDGWGTALKPAWEPICLARKPMIGTVAQNVLAHGTGAINVDGCKVGTDENLNGGAYSVDRKPSDSEWVKHGGTIHSYAGKDFEQPNGRWPANIIHDGSPEVMAAFPETTSGASSKPTEEYKPNGKNAVYGEGMGGGYHPGFTDAGSAARFFYTAKADADDRLGSKHPTIKPVDLMQYLARLVTPKGGTIIDPFAGTGTTGEAAWREGFRAVLIEREDEYQDDIRRRMALAFTGPDERAREAMKAKLRGKEIDMGPLFAK